ncbi:MAG: hypothetical protein Q8P06_00415 [Candidatus Azambacteria bacterium]|nr:hypothetical protein [Candidatus Azambacteria bacterium]
MEATSEIQRNSQDIQVSAPQTTKKRNSKPRIQIDFPSTPFTLEQLQCSYPDVSGQTLRIRIMSAMKDGIIQKGDGVKTGKKGRTKHVFCLVNKNEPNEISDN